MARKATSNDHYRLEGAYERLRRTLLEIPADGRLEKKLSYWVLPTDRRLPIALLDQKLSKLLKKSLQELLSTPGIGHKKILGFFELLRRVTKSEFDEKPFGLATSDLAHQGAAPSPKEFQPGQVSEAVWSGWCDTVRRNGLEKQKLGRLAPSLQSLPTVIWHTRMSDYIGLSLAEIRRLRTHGEKRIRAILGVFSATHEALSTSVLHESLEIEVVPRFIPKTTRWITETLSQKVAPNTRAVRDCLAEPMTHQIKTDLGEPVARLATERLRIGKNALSVKQLANSLGVTRARVYQLLDDCATVMEVRWPEGRWMLAPLANKFIGSHHETTSLILAIRELFYPDSLSTTDLSSPQAKRSNRVGT